MHGHAVTEVTVSSAVHLGVGEEVAQTFGHDGAPVAWAFRPCAPVCRRDVTVIEQAFHPYGTAVARTFYPCGSAFVRDGAAVEQAFHPHGLASAATSCPSAAALRRDVAVVAQTYYCQAAAAVVLLGPGEAARILRGYHHYAAAIHQNETEEFVTAVLREAASVAAAVLRVSATRVLLALGRSLSLIFLPFRDAAAVGEDLH